jgi:RNA polymerase sigma-70 factor (ECF subfamily)
LVPLVVAIREEKNMERLDWQLRSALGMALTVLRTQPMDALRDADARSPTSSETVRPTRRGAPSGAVAHEALEHLDSLHHFARYLTGSSEEAEDLVQDTYARALGAESTFALGTNMRAWLFRILRNCFIDGRRRSRTSKLTDGGAEEQAADRAAYSHEPLRGDHEMEALRGAVAQSIEHALAELSPDARTVVLLDLEGFTETEVSEVLGCPVGTVKSRLARARDSLRKLLSEYRR